MGGKGRNRRRRSKKVSGVLNKILVHTCRREDRCTELYMVDLDEDEATILPHHTLINERGASSMVELGSVIYLLGNYQIHTPTTAPTTDQIHFHGGVSYLDLSKVVDEDNIPGWKAAPPLKFPPPCLYVKPECVALCGKIFVFVFGIAEVFDPNNNNNNKWNQLLPPPGVTNFHISTPVLPDPSNNRILLRYKELGSLYAYYPADCRWELLVQDFQSWFTLPALQDDVIYFYQPDWHNNVVSAAYDLVAKQWLNIHLSTEFDGRVRHFEFDALVNLGHGIMCLTASIPHDTAPFKACVYIVKFRVYRKSARDVLVTTISARHHTINSCSSCTGYLPFKGTSSHLMQYLMDYEDKKFQNVSKEGLKLGKDSKVKELKESFKDLTKWWKGILASENVDDVKISNRLADSPCVVVTSKYGWSSNMERIMQSQTLSDASKQAYMRGKRVLEINPRHPIIKELHARIVKDPEDESVKHIAELMYQTALMESGFVLSDPKDFASRIYGSVKNSLNIIPDATVEEEDDIEVTEAEPNKKEGVDHAEEE